MEALRASSAQNAPCQFPGGRRPLVNFQEEDAPCQFPGGSSPRPPEGPTGRTGLVCRRISRPLPPSLQSSLSLKAEPPAFTSHMGFSNVAVAQASAKP